MDDHHERDHTSPGAPAVPDEDDGAPAPDFGPGGYLPDRASRRARKIVLRAPMGIQWVIAALVVGVIVAVAGWFALRDTAPTAPFVAVPAVLVAADGGVAVWGPAGSSTEALVVTVSNRTRVFAWPGGDPPVVCDESGLLEAPDDSTWRLTGRGLGGIPSLAEHPAVLHEGTLHVDPTTTLDPLPPDPARVETGCN